MLYGYVLFENDCQTNSWCSWWFQKHYFLSILPVANPCLPPAFPAVKSEIVRTIFDDPVFLSDPLSHHQTSSRTPIQISCGIHHRIALDGTFPPSMLYGRYACSQKSYVHTGPLERRCSTSTSLPGLRIDEESSTQGLFSYTQSSIPEWPSRQTVNLAAKVGNLFPCASVAMKHIALLKNTLLSS